MSSWKMPPPANGIDLPDQPATPEARAMESFRIQQDIQAGRAAAARERGALAGIDVEEATRMPSVLNRPPPKWGGTYKFTDPTGLEIELDIGRGPKWPAQLVKLNEEDGDSVVELTDAATDAGWRLIGRA